MRADLIKSLKFYVNELWKEENLVDISTPAYLTVISELENPETLENITSRLKRINFIESYTINELSKNLAKIKIRYLGKIRNLQESFAKNGFEFQIIHDQWILNLSS